MTSGTLEVCGMHALGRSVRFPGEPMRLRLEDRYPARDELLPAGVGNGVRIVWSRTKSILLWGGVSVDGHPFLEPAFVVNAPRALPDSGRVRDHRRNLGRARTLRAALRHARPVRWRRRLVVRYSGATRLREPSRRNHAVRAVVALWKVAARIARVPLDDNVPATGASGRGCHRRAGSRSCRARGSV